MVWDFTKYKEHIALQDDTGECITYGQLKAAGEDIAEKIGQRCLVFSLCSNTIGSVLGYTACLQHDIVPLLLSSHMDEELLKALLDEYHPSFVWCPADNNYMEKSSAAKKVFEAYGYALYECAVGQKAKLYEELGLLLTTSGSTGSPKLVRQSYKNIAANADQIARYLELDETERPITTLPMNYTYGLSIINSHLLVGATILLTDYGLMQKEFWQFLKSAEATSFGGVPYTYEMLDKLRFFRMDLPSLRYMTQAGGKLSPELHRKFAEYAEQSGKKFIVMYGQCEATARMSYLPAEKSLEKYGSMGIAIPDGTFSLIDVNGQVIEEAGKVGELVYEGPNVTLGYAEHIADLSLGDERHGRLETGDMAKRDADGYYYIVGRKKRFLKVYGNRVNLDEIDMMVKNEFGNVDCVTAGRDDHVCVFLTDESLVDSVRHYVADKTKLNIAAFHVNVLKEIPKNESGKVQYSELEQYY